jgi:heme a synthase
VLLAAAVWFFVRVRAASTERTSRRLNVVLFGLIAGQYLLGVATLLYYVPVSLGVLHQVMAMVIAGVWLIWLHHVRHLAPMPAPRADVGTPLRARGI